MSHVSDCDVLFKDLDLVEKMVAPFGGHLMRGQTTHKWYNRFMNDWDDPQAAVNRRDPATFGKCDHAIKFDGINYEIGLVKEAGGYRPIYDTYGSYGEHDGQKISALFGGVGLPKLKGLYAEQATIKTLSRQGFRMTKSIDPATGDILLDLVKA